MRGWVAYYRLAEVKGLFEELEKAFRGGFYDSKQDAIDMARRYADAKAGIARGDGPRQPAEGSVSGLAVAEDEA